MKEHIVYLALGTNLGDRLANLKQDPWQGIDKVRQALPGG